MQKPDLVTHMLAPLLLIGESRQEVTEGKCRHCIRTALCANLTDDVIARACARVRAPPTPRARGRAALNATPSFPPRYKLLYGSLRREDGPASVCRRPRPAGLSVGEAHPPNGSFTPLAFCNIHLTINPHKLTLI